MDNTFADSEKLYRAVFPASYNTMYWRKDGSLSSAAFRDKKGLSVERGDFRSDEDVVEEMQKDFRGSEIHGSEEVALLDPGQRKKLASVAKMEYYEI